jgi:hypothetical protein
VKSKFLALAGAALAATALMTTVAASAAPAPASSWSSSARPSTEKDPCLIVLKDVSWNLQRVAEPKAPLPPQYWAVIGGIRATLSCGIVRGTLHLWLQKKIELRGREVWATGSYAAINLRGKDRGYRFGLGVLDDCQGTKHYWRLLFKGSAGLAANGYRIEPYEEYWPHKDGSGRYLRCIGHPTR